MITNSLSLLYCSQIFMASTSPVQCAPELNLFNHIISHSNVLCTHNTAATPNAYMKHIDNNLGERHVHVCLLLADSSPDSACDLARHTMCCVAHIASRQYHWGRSKAFWGGERTIHIYINCRQWYTYMYIHIVQKYKCIFGIAVYI